MGALPLRRARARLPVPYAQHNEMDVLAVRVGRVLVRVRVLVGIWCSVRVRVSLRTEVYCQAEWGVI